MDLKGLVAFAFGLGASAALAQTPETPPPAAAPAGKSAAAAEKKAEGPDTWIFSGALQGSRETFSATLVANKGDAQFEMKLASGVTCTGGQLKGEVGLVRLPDITCSDERPMRALFVPQNGNVLKVFGHVGDERFMAEAHLLGTEAPPEAKQTAQPKGPLGLPPHGPAEPMPGRPKPSPSGR